MRMYLKNSLFLLGILVLAACDGSKDETPKIKLFPESFSLVFPSNNAVCQAGDLIADQANKLGITLEWKKSTNAITYELSLVNMVTGAEEVKLKTSNTQADVVLTKARLYQWKVTASNNNGEKESTEWSFYTKGDGIGNHIPYPAYDFEFTAVTTSNSLAVNWKASDEDQDSLSFDVKVFENDLEIISVSDLQNTSLSDIDIAIGSTYFLLVTVKDEISETIARSQTFTYN